MMKKIFIFILLFQVFLASFVQNVIADTNESYLTDQPLIISDIYITDNLTDLGAESFFICEETGQKLYEQINECLAVCENCAYQDNGCWRCMDNDEDNKDNNKSLTNGSWFQRFKNWFKQILVVIGNFFKKVANKPEPQLEHEPEQITKEHVEAAKKVFDYHKATTNQSTKKPTNQSVEDSLSNAFKKVKNFSDLLKLRALMMIYCNDVADKDYKKEKGCNDRFMALFRKKGDEFKERLIAGIDPQKGDAETYSKIIELDALLMAGESASGEGIWFSKDNIQKVRQQLKQKARIWFKVALEDIELEQIMEWYYLAMAYTSAQGEGTGIMEGIYPLDLVRDRAKVLLIKKLMILDICDPGKQELIEIKNLLSCEKLIIDDLVCKYIQEGNIEGAYARLYEIIIKKYPEKKQELPLPIICKKTEIEEQTGKQIDEEETTPEDVQLLEEPTDEGDLFSTKECNIEIYQKELVGWDFTIHNCEKSYNQGLSCFNHCGWLSSVYLEKSEHEVICYETMDGFVDKNFVVLCHLRPEPDSGIIQCVRDCLNQ